MSEDNILNNSKKIECTHDVQEYYKNIDECISEGINRDISNGLPEHAAYLLMKIFENAKKKIRIFSGGLANSMTGEDGREVLVYGLPALLSAAEKFLGKNNTRLEIVVQKSDFDVSEATSNLFMRFINTLRSENKIKGTIEIKIADAKMAMANTHFAVMDESGYRLELDNQKVKAIANFGDKQFTKKLATIFDNHIFSKATPSLATNLYGDYMRRVKRIAEDTSPYRPGVIPTNNEIGFDMSESKEIPIFPHYLIGKRIRSLSPEQLQDMLVKRDGMVCGICKRELTNLGGTNIDHIKPKAKGGTDDIVNLQIAHITCNTQKGASYTETSGD